MTTPIADSLGIVLAASTNHELVGLLMQAASIGDTEFADEIRTEIKQRKIIDPDYVRVPQSDQLQSS